MTDLQQMKELIKQLQYW